MSNYEQLLIIAGIIVGVSSVYSYKIFLDTYLKIKLRLAHRKAFKEREDSVKKYKEAGNLHKWVTLPVNIPGKGIKETQVCSETGYCPSVNGYIPVSNVKHMLAMQETEKQFQSFRKEELSRIQQYYSIADSDIDGLVADIYSIKQKFHSKKMEESIAEIKKQFPNVRVVTDMNELPGIIDEINRKKNS